MILIIFAWAYYFLLSLCIGAGLLNLIGRFAGPSIKLGFGIFYQFWFGFVALIGLLQLISLFSPLKLIAFIILALLATAFLVINYKSIPRKLSLLYQWLTTARGFFSLLTIFILVSLVAYSANREVLHADTFIYHFNAVKWAKEYPVVPGLANLHSRLGFNSSFFLFAALTEIGPYADQSAHVALSFIIVVALVHWFFIISNAVEVMRKKIFCMMTALFLVIHALTQLDITSLSTDYPTAILTLVFCVVLLDKLEHKIILLLPLSAAAFSFKLSGALLIGFALLALAGNVFMVKYGSKTRVAKKSEIRIFSSSLTFFCFVVLGFVIRNAFVSGWLFYPLPIGNLHLPWTVPKPYVVDLMEWIKSWPKMPGGASPTVINGHHFFYWMVPWFNQFRDTLEFTMLCASLFILLGAILKISSFVKFFYARLDVMLLLFLSIGNILFWFISAPDVRFGSVNFFIFFAGTIILFYEADSHKIILKYIISAGFTYQMVSWIPSHYILDRQPDLFTFPYTKPLKLKREIISPAGETPPLFIYRPAEGDACGNSPLPCTPYAGSFVGVNGEIRQRVPGDISKGFLPMEYKPK